MQNILQSMMPENLKHKPHQKARHKIIVKRMEILVNYANFDLGKSRIFWEIIAGFPKNWMNKSTFTHWDSITKSYFMLWKYLEEDCSLLWVKLHPVSDSHIKTLLQGQLLKMVLACCTLYYKEILWFSTLQALSNKMVKCCPCINPYYVCF